MCEFSVGKKPWENLLTVFFFLIAKEQLFNIDKFENSPKYKEIKIT